MRKVIPVAATALLAISLSHLSAAPDGELEQSKGTRTPPSLRGTWKVTEIAHEGGERITKPQPGLYIFAEKHYSIVQVIGKAPRPILPSVAKATPEQLLSVFGEVFQAQAGSYQLAGMTLTLRPTVAKNPAVMTGSYYAEYDVSVTADGLELLFLTQNGKSIPTPTTYKLQKLD